MPPHGQTIPAHHLIGNTNAMETGSSCHQCKSRRPHSELIYCTQQQKKKPKGAGPNVPLGCRKKYCEHCLMKFYQEHRPSELQLKNWSCPSCRNECSCAACRKKDTEPIMEYPVEPPRVRPPPAKLKAQQRELERERERLKAEKDAAKKEKQAATATAATTAAAQQQQSTPTNPAQSQPTTQSIQQQRRKSRDDEMEDESAAPQPSRDRMRERLQRAAAHAEKLDPAHPNASTTQPTGGKGGKVNLEFNPLGNDGQGAKQTPYKLFKKGGGPASSHDLALTSAANTGPNTHPLSPHNGPQSTQLATTNLHLNHHGLVDQHHLGLGSSPHMPSTSQFGFPGLQSPQQGSVLMPGHFSPHEARPLFSTAHHLNQLKTQQALHHQQHHPLSQGQQTVQQGPAASGHISPNLQPLFRPIQQIQKSPQLVPTNSGPLTLKGSPPFNAVSLTGKGGNHLSSSSTPNLNQLTSKFAGAFNTGLFDPCPNPLLSSLINANRGPGSTITPNTNSAQLASPKTSGLNVQLRTSTIGVASPAFTSNEIVGASPKIGPNGGQGSGTVPLDFQGFASPLMQGISHFPHHLANHAQNQTGAGNGLTNSSNKKEEGGGGTGGVPLNPQLKNIAVYNPASSLLHPQTTPHSGLFTSIPVNVNTTNRILGNLSKDALSLATNGQHGVLDINVNNHPTFSLNGRPVTGINLTDTSPQGLAQAKATILGLIQNLPDVGPQQQQQQQQQSNGNNILGPNNNQSHLGLNQTTASGLGLGSKFTHGSHHGGNMYFAQNSPGSFVTPNTQPLKRSSPASATSSFAQLHPSQQTSVMVTTLLEVLQYQNAVVMASSPNSTTTSMGDNHIIGQQLPPEDEAGSSGNVTGGDGNHGEMKEVLDFKLQQLQLEHQSLLSLIDKTNNKLAKNGGKGDKAEYVELIKHLSAGLKRVQTDISDIQYKMDIFASKLPQIVTNEAIVALFALLWTMAHTPQVQTQLGSIAQQAFGGQQGQGGGQAQGQSGLTDRLTRIHQLFLANISLAHQSTPNGGNGGNGDEAEGHGAGSGGNGAGSGAGSGGMMGDGSGSNPLSGLGVDLLANTNNAHNSFANLFGFSLGQSKVQSDATSLSKQHSGKSGGSSTATTPAHATSAIPSTMTNSDLSTSPSTMNDGDSHDNSPSGPQKRKATAEMNNEIAKDMVSIPPHPSKA